MTRWLADPLSVEEPGRGVPPVGDERREQQGHDEVDAGEREQPEHPAHLAAQASRVHQHDPLAQLGVLIGELERHSPAEGLAHDRRPLDAQHVEQVTDGAGMAAERVIAGRLVRAPVPEEVGSHHREAPLQEPHGGEPGVRAPGDPVEQDQYRARPRLPVGDPGSVQRQVLHRVRLLDRHDIRHTPSVAAGRRRDQGQMSPSPPSERRGRPRPDDPLVVTQDRLPVDREPLGPRPVWWSPTSPGGLQLLLATDGDIWGPRATRTGP